MFEIDCWTIFNVCGNIWEIKKEWINKIIRPRESIEGGFIGRVEKEL